MRNYVDGKEYFIKGKARSGELPGRPVEFAYESGYGTNCGVLADEPGLLLTAEEVAQIHNRDITNLERAVEELREENEAFRKRCDELQKTCEEDTTVAIDLANQRDNFKKHLETALKDFAVKDKAYNETLKDKQDLQKAVEGLNKEIDGYRATIQKMAAVIGFLCGGGQDG